MSRTSITVRMFPEGMKDHYPDMSRDALIARLPEHLRSKASGLGKGFDAVTATLLPKELEENGMGEEASKIVESLRTKGLGEAFGAAVIDEAAALRPDVSKPTLAR